MNWTTDRDGRLLLNHIHDATISGVSFKDGVGLDVFITSANGVVTTCKIKNVSVIRIADFWGNAIVSDIFLWNSQSVPVAYFENEDAGWYNLLATRTHGVEGVKQEAQRISTKFPNKTLLSIVCSYGGGISALGDEIVFER